MEDVLSLNVLVLNRSYKPIKIISVKKALILLYKTVAEVIQVEDGNYANYDFHSWAEVSAYKRMYEDNPEMDWVFTPQLTINVPRVIRVLTFDKYVKYNVKLNRRNIYARDGDTCQYCGKKHQKKHLNIDHVVPKVAGGKTIWENLVVSCFKCNTKKGGRTPKEAGMVLLKQPKKPDFTPALRIHIGNKKYESWRQFLDDAYWLVSIEDEAPENE
jgi:5-methylcytosine-specific restriction endonuclease McrA